jgi:carboxymethylenebutenolidase
MPLDRVLPRLARWLIIASLPIALLRAAPPPIPPLAERVTFPSADNTTMLVAYLFRPQGPHPARMPAVVMMHGRAGAYSEAADGEYDERTLSRRHQQWGHFWAEQGYLAVLVDGFGPRGYPHGFPKGSYQNRPEALNEVTVRPLDAYGALVWLRRRSDVIPDRIGLQGWSNGGSASLATMAQPSAPGVASPTPETGFRGALVFYPACGLKGQFENGIVPYAPVRVLQGSADEEVSPVLCQELVNKSRAHGGDIEYVLYQGATHDFDDPGTDRRSVPANVAAANDAFPRAANFFATILRGR